MIETHLNLSVNEIKWDSSFPQYKTLCPEILSLTINYIHEHKKLDVLSHQKPLIFNLCLSNDVEIQQLNKEFRHLDKPTNVLSFANIDDPFFNTQLNLEKEIEMGDIMIALETLQTEATIKNIPLQHHFTHLFIHGILHLLGYDHIEDDEAEVMEAREQELLDAWRAQ